MNSKYEFDPIEARMETMMTIIDTAIFTVSTINP